MDISPAELVETYGGRLFGLCVHLTRDRDAAEELYQETWVRVLMQLDRYRPDRPFEPWLDRICVNIYRDSLRRQKLRRSLPLPEDAEPEPSPYPDADLRMDLAAAVEKLPEKLRLAVILVCYQGLSEKEAAAALYISPGGVKSRLSRARKILKEALLDA